MIPVASNLIKSNKKAFRSCHGYYLSAQADDSGSLDWDRSSINDWEIFTIVKNSEDTFAIKTAHGKYLSVSKEFAI